MAMKGVGSGTMRVGWLIGRLGVISVPAVAIGLGLEERVVRRHRTAARGGVAEQDGGDPGSGVACVVDLGGPQGRRAGWAARGPVVAGAVGDAQHAELAGRLVAWSAVRAQRRSRRWPSGRELAVDPDRWSVAMSEPERGLVRRLLELVAADQPARVRGHRRTGPTPF